MSTLNLDDFELKEIVTLLVSETKKTFILVTLTYHIELNR